MKISGHTILITGGATGIGFALAEAFTAAGNKVVICGRRENVLKQAKSKLPQIHTIACDLSKKSGRQYLCATVAKEFNNINILVNNAGIQNIIDLKKGVKETRAGEQEIIINLVVPVFLSAYFAPLFCKKDVAAILNISSSLGFVPKANKPVYCATKAAIHSFSLSLRHQLQDTKVKVFEIIPPVVDTELVKRTSGEIEGFKGIKSSEVATAVLNGLGNDEYEIAIGKAREVISRVRPNPEQAF